MTATLERPNARIEDLTTLVTEFCEVLNAKEVERRREVNSHHFGQYGRLLYPEGTAYCTYAPEGAGRKYIRIVQTLTDGGNKMVHCFIDKATGDVLKSAGWKAPAKGARFNLLDGVSRESLYERCEFTAGYLYR